MLTLPELVRADEEVLVVEASKGDSGSESRSERQSESENNGASASAADRLLLNAELAESFREAAEVREQIDLLEKRMKMRERCTRVVLDMGGTTRAASSPSVRGPLAQLNQDQQQHRGHGDGADDRATTSVGTGQGTGVGVGTGGTNWACGSFRPLGGSPQTCSACGRGEERHCSGAARFTNPAGRESPGPIRSGELTAALSSLAFGPSGRGSDSDSGDSSSGSGSGSGSRQGHEPHHLNRAGSDKDSLRELRKLSIGLGMTGAAGDEQKERRWRSGDTDSEDLGISIVENENQNGGDSGISRTIDGPPRTAVMLV
eukprot:g1815.t1